MFAVYDNTSMNFRGTIEELYNVKKVEKLSKVQKYGADFKPEENFIIEQEGITQNAIKSYKKVANIDIKEEIYHVYRIMSDKCISINNKKTLEDAYEVLSKNNINQLPVTTSENKIIGILDKKEILNTIIKDLDSAKQIMSNPLNQIKFSEFIITDPISDIRRVAKVMIDFDMHAIPVVDSSGTLIGVISQTDILKAVSTIPALSIWV